MSVLVELRGNKQLKPCANVVEHAKWPSKQPIFDHLRAITGFYSVVYINQCETPYPVCVLESVPPLSRRLASWPTKFSMSLSVKLG